MKKRKEKPLYSLLMRGPTGGSSGKLCCASVIFLGFGKIVKAHNNFCWSSH